MQVTVTALVGTGTQVFPAYHGGLSHGVDSGLTTRRAGVFSFDGPTVSAAHLNGPISGGASVTVAGLNFGYGQYTATVTMLGGPCATTSWSSGTGLSCLSQPVELWNFRHGAWPRALDGTATISTLCSSLGGIASAEISTGWSTGYMCCPAGGALGERTPG